MNRRTLLKYSIAAPVALYAGSVVGRGRAPSWPTWTYWTMDRHGNFKSDMTYRFADDPPSTRWYRLDQRRPEPDQRCFVMIRGKGLYARFKAVYEPQEAFGASAPHNVTYWRPVE